MPAITPFVPAPASTTIRGTTKKMKQIGIKIDAVQSSSENRTFVRLLMSDPERTQRIWPKVPRQIASGINRSENKVKLDGKVIP